jgi:DNA-binding response OmpR family regulator
MTAQVLIVEDDDILRKHLARLFAREGYTVVTAASRGEALAQLGRARFEVLLLDVMLPDGDGLDLLAQIREHAPRQIVVMTACDTPENQRRADLLNVGDVLPKPIDLLRLLQTIRGRRPPRSPAAG